jgi:DNA-binding IclR family transcriptional regulator
VLANLAPAERDRLLPGRLVRLTARTMTRLGDLRRELGRIGARGYATAVDELESGFTAVGAPVRNYSGKLLGALSVGGPSLRLKPARLPKLGRLVCEAAADVSRRLGS